MPVEEVRGRFVGAEGAPLTPPAELVRLVVDRLSDGLIVRDAAGRPHYVNDAAAQLCGYPNAAAFLAAPGKEPILRFDIYDEAGAAVAPEELPIERSRLTGRPVESMLRLRLRGSRDQDRWILVSATPILEGGFLRFVIGVLHDHTDRKRREEEIAFRAEANACLAGPHAIEEALAALAELTVERLASGAFFYLAGEGGGLALVSWVVDGSGAVPPDPARLVGSGVLELDGDSVIAEPMRAREREVGLFVLLRGRDRPPFGVTELALVRSLASRAGLAIDNSHLAREAARAVRAREDFLAICSHDLKSPLAAIHFSATAILRDAIVPRVRRAADTVLGAVQNMERLVHDLVDLGAIEGGRLALVRCAVDAGELVRNVLSLLEPVASKGSVSLRLEARSEVAVLCDGERIQQVLTNLVGNAVSFSPVGAEVLVTVETSGDRAVFAVIDKGPGISTAALPFVFEHYWQGEARGPGNAGLGLSIAKALALAHGGEIWVESEPGRGSSFFFSLPLA